MQEDPVLLLYLTCKDPAGQVSALPVLSPGTRPCRQHLLPPALPNPHIGMGRCFSPCGQTRCSHSHREHQDSARGEEVTAIPQSLPKVWAGCKPQLHQAPILTPSPLGTLQSRISPKSPFLSLVLCLPVLQSESLEILVTVLNMNDNEPVFAHPNLARELPEVRGFWKGRGHCSLRKGQQGEDSNPFHADSNHNNVVFQDTKVDTAIVAREELSATDADLDTIYYELTTTVQVSISGDKQELWRSWIQKSPSFEEKVTAFSSPIFYKTQILSWLAEQSHQCCRY